MLTSDAAAVRRLSVLVAAADSVLSCCSEAEQLLTVTCPAVRRPPLSLDAMTRPLTESDVTVSHVTQGDRVSIPCYRKP